MHQAMLACDRRRHPDRGGDLTQRRGWTLGQELCCALTAFTVAYRIYAPVAPTLALGCGFSAPEQPRSPATICRKDPSSTLCAVG